MFNKMSNGLGLENQTRRLAIMFIRSSFIRNLSLILPLNFWEKPEIITAVVESIAENEKKQRGKHFEIYF